jgi:hypothetical protein
MLASHDAPFYARADDDNDERSEYDAGGVGKGGLAYKGDGEELEDEFVVLCKVAL